LLRARHHLPRRLDTIKRLEEAGISAIVLPPLFEEKVLSEEMAMFHSIDMPADSFS